MRYFIVFYSYSVDAINERGNSVLPLELQHYPNLVAIGGQIKSIVSNSLKCNYIDVSFGIYNIQEVNGVDFNHFIS